MAPEPRRVINFPPFHIPSDVDLLYCGEEVVRLEPQAVRVLRYLAENHDRVIPKDELLEHIWPDVFTTEGVLKRAISQARRALGDEAEGSRLIQTYHRRGYRFIGPVSVITAPAGEGAALPPEPADPDYDQLAGRGAELDALRAEYRRTLGGAGRPVLILGEPGMGKTQLARHFQSWAREQGALGVYARFFDYRASRLAPYEVFLDCLRLVLDLAGPGTGPEGGGHHDLRAAVRARCGVTLPEELFAGAAEGTGPLPTHAGAAAVDAYRAFVPLGESFIRLSRQRPLVMTFDDLQWADEASRDLISHLMHKSQGEPLMLVALMRKSGTADLSHPLAEWLRRQADYRSYTSLVLKPLDEQSYRLAIESIFGGVSRGPDPSPHDLQLLHRITGGNPYFLTEVLRLLVAGGAVSFGGTPRPRWQWHGIRDLELPETIVMIARAKLDRLPEPVRGIVEQAAVIGDEFRVETLARMAGRGEEEVERLLREGVHYGVLSERGLVAGEDCRFYHTILRRVLYEGLASRRRKQLHAQAAQAIEAVYSREADRVASALSVHYEAAGDLRRAVEWSLQAWQAARHRWQWDEAVACIERARRAADELDRLGQGGLAVAERLKVLLGIGEGYCSVGRLKEAGAALTEAIATARALGDQPAEAAGLLQQGRTFMGLSQYDHAADSTGQGLTAYRRLRDRQGVAVSLLQLSSIQVALGNYEAVEDPTTEVFAGPGAEDRLSAAAVGLLGWARVLQGRYSEGVPLLERALSHHADAGDVRGRAQLLRRLHWAHLGRGQYETALRLAERARDDFRSIGDVSGEAKLSMSIGQARVAQGLFDEGIAILQRALESLTAIGDTHCEAESLWLLGRAHGEAGRLDEAAEWLARALALVRAVGDRDDEFRVLTDVARVRLSAGDAEGGRRAADLAVAIAEELQNRDGLGAALVEASRAHLQLRRPAEALRLAERAVKLLDEAGSGDRWRAYWALAQAAEGPGADRPATEPGRRLLALRSCVALLDGIREQFDPPDAARRAAVTRARSGPARDLHALLLRSGLEPEAKVVADRWLLDNRPPH